MLDLSTTDVVRIHDRLVATTGGSLGIREPGLLAAIVEKPKASFGGKDLYPTWADKAAALFEAICNYHVFVDGNKRTAITCLEYYLFRNNYELTADSAQKERFVRETANSHPDLADVASWVRKNARERTRS